MSPTSLSSGPKRRLSNASKRVLAALYEASPGRMCGIELMDAARAPSGTLYPILSRFRDWGWMACELEDIDPTVAGRHPRTYYWLTEAGRSEANRRVPYLPVDQLATTA